MLEGMAATPDDGGTTLFRLRTPDAGQDLEAFLDAERVELTRGRRAAVLVIPETFDEQVFASLGSPNLTGTSVDLYMTSASVASETASAILEQAFASLDREILARVGRWDQSRTVEKQFAWIGQMESGVGYVDLVLPAIVLMGFFTSGLFGIPGTILFNRDRKVLRRYWVTPLAPSRYLAGLAVGHAVLCALQFALIVALGRLAFGATVRFASLTTALWLILAVLTFLALGFLVTVLAKTANAGMATANILNMPMMFLSGMFFPVAGLPLFVRVLVLANPVTYLLEALRKSVGVQDATLMPWPWTLIVPLAWIVFCSTIAARRLRWDVSR
ncbi:MAG TPA: ABC transporter permease [Candidatus Acetothermia bacterium]|nr:ABC transporter permease [Candidatus Acetothermia bacterium]